MSRKQRRQIVIDRQFQMQYFKIWLTVGVGLVILSVGFYLLMKRFSGTGEMPDAIILRVLGGVSLFVIIFSALMGLISLAMTHRVAGAAWRLEQFTKKVMAGEPQPDVTLRRGDYLQSLAQQVNGMKNVIEQQRAFSRELLAQIESIRDKVRSSLSEEERQTWERFYVRLQSANSPSGQISEKTV